MQNSRDWEAIRRHLCNDYSSIQEELIVKKDVFSFITWTCSSCKNEHYSKHNNKELKCSSCKKIYKKFEIIEV